MPTVEYPPLRTWCHSPTVVHWCDCNVCSEAMQALREVADRWATEQLAQVSHRDSVLLYYPPGEFEDTADTEPDVDPNACVFCGGRESPGQYGPFCGDPECPVYDPTSGQR